MNGSSNMIRTSADKTSKETPHEFLSFRVGGQDYCLDIMSVREIRAGTRATPLPHAPQFMRGVINLRGTVLPVMDLSSRLDLGAGSDRDGNVIIVVTNGDHIMGLLVDAVSDILAVPEKDMQTPPDLTVDRDRSFISALMIVDDRVIRILDLDAVLSPPNKGAA